MLKEDFLKEIHGWSNHRILLWPALEATKHLKLPVLELGAGSGSTPYLREYCKDAGLDFITCDNASMEYANMFQAVYTPDWDNSGVFSPYWGVVLVDHSPGEHRKIAISKLHHAQIIVVHDTEKEAEHDYKMNDGLTRYKYLLDYQPGGAGATAVSDFIDVTKFEL